MESVFSATCVAKSAWEVQGSERSEELWFLQYCASRMPAAWTVSAPTATSALTLDALHYCAANHAAVVGRYKNTNGGWQVLFDLIASKHSGPAT